MKKVLFALLLSGIVVTGCKQGLEKKDKKQESQESVQTELQIKANKYFAPLPEVAENPDNPLSEAKIKLGKTLYFDTRLSKDGNNSCNSCHNLETYGVDNLPTSPGDAGKNGDRNSPTVLNAALHFSQFWDGRNKDVEEQAGGPILNPVEMAIPSEEFLIKRLSEVEEYKVMFSDAYPDEEDPLSYQNLTKAIAAFERTLLTPSKFDQFLKGDADALTENEKKGLETFIDVGCIICHSGTVLGGNMFQKFGLFGDYWEHTVSDAIDEGRFTETGNDQDKYIFKVPSLRNIEKTYPYFHDGSVNDLTDAVGIMSKLELNKNLSEEEISDIIAFLESLTGEVVYN